MEDRLRVFAVLLHEDLAVATDNGQQVVEIVRDSTASVPTASIFCAWRSCSSRALRSVTSSAITSKLLRLRARREHHDRSGEP